MNKMGGGTSTGDMALTFNYRNSFRVKGDVNAYLDKVIEFREEQLEYFGGSPDTKDVLVENLELHTQLRSGEISNFMSVDDGRAEVYHKPSDEDELLVHIYVHPTVSIGILTDTEKRFNSEAGWMKKTGCQVRDYADSSLLEKTIKLPYNVKLLGRDLKVWDKAKQELEDGN
jgi:hypothetical protein